MNPETKTAEPAPTDSTSDSTQKLGSLENETDAHDVAQGVNEQELAATRSSVAERLKKRLAALVSEARPLSNRGDAQRLADMHRDSLRYVSEWSEWLTWDGRRWAPASDEKVMARHVVDSVRQLRDVATKLLAAVSRPDDAKDEHKWLRSVVTWAEAGESLGRLDACLRLARGMDEFHIAPAALDAHPMLLNCPNGTVDLRTGALLKHDPRLLLTKMAGCSFDPSATCPTLDAFMRSTHASSPEVVDYLQRVLGYSLTGDVTEQQFWVHQGAGADGKSVSMRLMQDVLGDYATVLDSKVLITTKSDQHPTAIAGLQGARFAVVSEVRGSFDPSAVKLLTGSNILSARKMRQDFWTFRPTHKLHVQLNKDLQSHEEDPAVWRRLRKVPYKNSLIGREAEQDTRLGDKLRAELPGALAWLVRGCLDWQARGLQTPQVVLDATAQYRADEDTLGDFLNECTDRTDPNTFTSRKDLRETYEAWCRERGEPKLLHAKSFVRELRAKGLVEHMRTGTRGWSGASLVREATMSGSLGRIVPLKRSGLAS